MGLVLLGNWLSNGQRYGLDDSVYVLAGEELSLEAQVKVLP